RHTRWPRDWSSDVCSSDLILRLIPYRSQSSVIVHSPDCWSAMKRTRSSIAQLSCQGIDWSSQPTENCYPSIRSTLLPIYPVWTARHLLPQGQKVRETIGVEQE